MLQLSCLWALKPTMKTQHTKKKKKKKEEITVLKLLKISEMRTDHWFSIWLSSLLLLLIPKGAFITRYICMCVRACVSTFSSLPLICLSIWNYVTTETFIADKTSTMPVPTFSSKISLLFFRILDWNFTKFLPPPMHWKFFLHTFCIQIRLVKVHIAYLVSICYVFPIIYFMFLSRFFFFFWVKVSCVLSSFLDIYTAVTFVN